MQTFKKLKDSMSKEEFDRFCTKLAEEYAKSELKFSRSYWTKEEEITESCFYKILERAVIENLVSNEVVTKMMEKASANQGFHAEGAGSSTFIHYSNLIRERNKRIVEKMSNDEIKRISIEFANHPEITKRELAEKYEVYVAVINCILQKGIIEMIIDDETFEKIRERSLKKDSSTKVKKYFNSLACLRKAKNEGSPLN